MTETEIRAASADICMESARQARRNAAWWRAELAGGRITPARDLVWLLRDLEAAGKGSA